MLKRLWDLTYWEVRRRLRICAGCGERRSREMGKVNFGFAFDNPKRLYHFLCWKQENERRKNG